ncbi:hypothetical protein ACWEU6_11690 [Streptosporangium sandarakinum]|uniref:hypothetical protein n=1 Tax=Streptosporangium sandarakinum TaxID=1260955 RepID=UPI00368D2040
MADANHADELLSTHLEDAAEVVLKKMDVHYNEFDKLFRRILEEIEWKKDQPNARDRAELLLRALALLLFRTSDYQRKSRFQHRTHKSLRKSEDEAWREIFVALLWGTFPRLSSTMRMSAQDLGGLHLNAEIHVHPEVQRTLVRIARDAGLPALTAGGKLQDADFGTAQFLAGDVDVRLARLLQETDRHAAKPSKFGDISQLARDLIAQYYLFLNSLFEQAAEKVIENIADSRDALAGEHYRYLTQELWEAKDPIQWAQFRLLKALADIVSAHDFPADDSHVSGVANSTAQEAALSAELGVSINLSSSMSEPAPLVVVYLPNEDNYSEVKEAIAGVLDAFGMEILSEGGIIHGSIWQSFVAVFKRRTTEEQADQALTKVQRAVELRGVDKPQADVTRTQSESVAKLLDSLKDNPSALIQIGNILVAKVNGIPIALELSQVQLVHLQSNPLLYTDPARAVDELGKIQGLPNGSADELNLPRTFGQIH